MNVQDAKHSRFYFWKTIINVMNKYLCKWKFVQYAPCWNWKSFSEKKFWKKCLSKISSLLKKYDELCKLECCRNIKSFQRMFLNIWYNLQCDQILYCIDDYVNLSAIGSKKNFVRLFHKKNYFQSNQNLLNIFVYWYFWSMLNL